MCRICTAQCGTVVTVSDERVAAIGGDHGHPLSEGYACIKGLQATEAMYGADRLLLPQKRTPAGFVSIPLEQALDEIADRLRSILTQSPPESVATFKGTQTYQNATASAMMVGWMTALKSPSVYSTMTIDQSSHVVTMGRMGSWQAGKPDLEQSDVALLVGTNPMVSIAAYGVLDYNPAKRLKAARRRGLKLIVVDPRRTETAIQADCNLQLIPGEDVTLLAGIIALVLQNGWHDAAFCERFANGMDELRSAVAPFTPQFVESRAGVASADLELAASMFARDARRGVAIMGTGGAMAPRSNLADHLVEVLNAICGRYLRQGERVPNPGVLSPAAEFREEVVPPTRPWEAASTSSTGHGALFGERMSGILADEMLGSGPQRIRALFVNGANPAVALPNQQKAVAGLKALDLLVAVEPFMTATAMLSHYIIPPKLLYERADVAKPPWLESYLGGPAFNQYLPALVPPPPGAEVIDDWYLYWALAKRLGMNVPFNGVELDTSGEPPTTEALLDLFFRDARIALDQVAANPQGFVSTEEVFVAAGSGNARLELAPSDVVEELATVAGEGVNNSEKLRLIVRRERSVLNSFGRTLKAARKRGGSNPLSLHPDDLNLLRIEPGDRVQVRSAAGRVMAIVASDPTLRPGVASMAHCWGLLPEDDFEAEGASTSLLVDTEHGVESINAMPAMTAIPIHLSKL